jgi:prepilin-type N-terminal cleavage/methylation domain-containing protein
MKKETRRGFTLIDLLVVIAIIGILSSVILASLNTARDKGADAAIKSDLNNIRSQAELYYDQNSQDYTGVCADPTMVRAQTSAEVTNGGTAGACDEAATYWVMWVPLKTNATAAWCVDNGGASKEITPLPAAPLTACP